MKRVLSIFFVVTVFGLINTYAQVGPPSNIYTSATGRQRSPAEIETLKRISDNERSNAAFDRLRSVSSPNGNSGSVFITKYPLSLASRAKKHVIPKAELLSKYASFLKAPNTGIVKLLPAKACLQDENEKNPNLKQMVERCPSSFIPDGARYFSFRKKDYVKASFADIGFSEKFIFSFGTFNQGILVNLGDVSLDNIPLSSQKLAFLANFAPSTNIDNADIQYKEFDEGLESDGMKYSHMLPVEIDKTYALRVVAYKADYFQTFKILGRNEKVYPLKGDIREDLLVVFRIVDENADDGLTMVWKEIQRKEAPEMKMPKVEKSTNPK